MFSLPTLILKLVSGAALLTLIATIIDTLALYLLPNKGTYRKIVYEESPDFKKKSRDIKEGSRHEQESRDKKLGSQHHEQDSQDKKQGSHHHEQDSRGLKQRSLEPKEKSCDQKEQSHDHEESRDLKEKPAQEGIQDLIKESQEQKHKTE